MTSEEIKERYSMEEIIGRYGYRPNRAGFISCPFHKEKTASMKIYKDSYNCFGCGANGDVFTFIQKMEHMDFKEAFYELGGEYSEHDKKEGKFSQRRKKQMLEYRRIEMQKRKKRLLNQIRKLNKEICMLKKIMNDNLPYINENGEAMYPKVWCYAANKFEYELYRLEILKQQMEEGGCKGWRNLGS